jgi:hypothetical protein
VAELAIIVAALAFSGTPASSELGGEGGDSERWRVGSTMRVKVEGERQSKSEKREREKERKRL